MAKNATATGWPIKICTIHLHEDTVHVALGGGGAAQEAALARVRADGEAALDELRRSPAAGALTAQRELLTRTRADLAEAQSAAAEARRLRGESLALGRHPGDIENALARAVAAAGGLASREVELLAAIAHRESELADLWADLRGHLFDRLRREAPARLAAAGAALGAALPAALVRELVEATALSALMGGSPELLGILPERPFGRTVAPPAPGPAASAEPQYGPNPPIPEAIKCPQCRETAHVEVDGLKHESVLTCPRCGPFDPPEGHELCGQVVRVTQPQRPLEPVEA